MDVSTTLKGIFGYFKGLVYNEALIYFSENPMELDKMMEKYGDKLIMPEQNLFTWGDYIALHKAGPDIVFLDNQVSSLAHVGLEESAQSMGEFTRKISYIQKQYCIPTIVISQEAMRKASQNELEKNDQILEYGTGQPRYSTAPNQEASLLMRISKTPHGMTRELKIANGVDRFRGLNNDTVNYRLEFTSRGLLEGELLSTDKVRTFIDRAKKMEVI
jgi:hypothetical protein